MSNQSQQNASDFEGLLGKESSSPEVAALLESFAAPAPRLKQGDVDANVVLKSAGLELVFTDEGHFTHRDDLALGEGALVLTAIMFKSSRVADFNEFTGTLPRGITFADSDQALHTKLGMPEMIHPKQPKEIWTLDGLKLFVTFDQGKGSIKQLTLQAPDSPKA